jgi:hypothetical protein
MHYGFVEFEDSETAFIVAKSVHNYFIGDKRLVAHQVPQEKVHETFWFRKPFVDPASVKPKVTVHASTGLPVPSKGALKRLYRKERLERARVAELGFLYAPSEKSAHDLDTDFPSSSAPHKRGKGGLQSYPSHFKVPPDPKEGGVEIRFERERKEKKGKKTAREQQGGGKREEQEEKRRKKRREEEEEEDEDDDEYRPPSIEDDDEEDDEDDIVLLTEEEMRQLRREQFGNSDGESDDDEPSSRRAHSKRSQLQKCFNFMMHRVY